MVSNLIGVVNDVYGDMVSVEADGPQVVIGFTASNWRVFDPGQITELIAHLEAARDEALANELNAPHDETDDE